VKHDGINVDDLQHIAHALGGEVLGHQVLAPGPGHSSHDRSLAVRPVQNAPDGLLIYSHSGDDWRRCREHVLLRVIRFHAACPWRDNVSGDLVHIPAMLAVMRNIDTNEVTAVQRTALSQTGEKIGRMALGRKTGAAIKLSADEDVTMGLAIGEGLETVLSAMQLGFTPAWALGDASNVRHFPVVSGIECLTIIVDNDESGTGQRAALECSSRWTSAGREVFRVIPDRCGQDMNDVVRRTVA
jgi:hypothetical protein